ncbi:MAG: hypothetical protein U9O53_05220 [archaeon]|nr:hypothetical protein [archaeon]
MVDALDWQEGGIGQGNPKGIVRPGWVAVGLNTYRKIKMTAVLGGTQGIYDSLLGNLCQNEYKILKVDEDFHVTPSTQNPFYQNAKAQRGELERIISTTLTDIGNEVGQWQLLEHDVRKAEEMLNYFGESDEAALKTMFVDQVDYYTGGGGAQGEGRLSMAFMRKSNIMPTIVEDFLSMNSPDDLKEEGVLGKLPQVEKNFLKAKWSAYTQWKTLFRSGIDQRYNTVKSLCQSKEKYLDERREWLKPHVMQHKMLNNALSSEGGRAGAAGNFFDRPGEARSFTNQTIWLWKPIRFGHSINRTPDEMYKNPRHIGKGVKAYDYHIQEKFIFNGKIGLLKKYPWITEKQIEDYVNDRTTISKRDAKLGVADLQENEWYYTVWTIDFGKCVFNVMANGQPTPLEDGTWIIHGYVATKNMLMLKLLERNCEDDNTEIEMKNIINMDREKYSIKYHLPSENGPYRIKKSSLEYEKKKDILGGKSFKKDADEKGNIDIDGKKYKEEDFIFFDAVKLKDLREKGGSKGIKIEGNGDVIIPGGFWASKDDDNLQKARENALNIIKDAAQAKLAKFNDYRDIVMQRESAPKKENKAIKNFMEMLENFGIELKWRVEPGPYQAEMFDALTQGMFKLAGSSFWGAEIIGPLYRNMNIPW